MESFKDDISYKCELIPKRIPKISNPGQSERLRRTSPEEFYEFLRGDFWDVYARDRLFPINSFLIYLIFFGLFC